jgi:diguanylate cyclase (GGDEF)-like protein
MLVDLRTLLIALTINLITMAVALPLVMGRVSAPARRAQEGAGLQAAGWVFILASGLMLRGGLADRLLSTLAMASMALSLAFLATAFELWSGRRGRVRLQWLIALLMPLGYTIGFAHYPFRVGWANGLLAGQMLLIVATMARPAPQPIGRWRWLVVISLTLHAAVTLARGTLGAFFTEAYPRFLSPHPINYAAAVVALVTAMLTVLGILLAHRDEAARALERLATVDGLTGVLNRRAWLELARARLEAGRRRGVPAAVLMFDIDRFKQINDTLGHEAGDRALCLVARELARAAGEHDLVGRYGGEEFCVLLAEADEANATRFDARMRRQLAVASQAELGFVIGYSAGLSRCRGGPDSLESMLRRADAALYRAKDAGRDRTLDTGFGLLQAA